MTKAKKSFRAKTPGFTKAVNCQGYKKTFFLRRQRSGQMGEHLVLPSSIRLGWNALAYFVRNVSAEEKKDL
jgi:hypothetical protein